MEDSFDCPRKIAARRFPSPRCVRQGVADYLDYCLTRQGKTGCGLGVRTHEANTYRLGFLLEFRPDSYLDHIDKKFIREFLAFLRCHERDLGDRTCYTIVQAVSTFLLHNGIGVARPYLKDISYPPTEINQYLDEDLVKSFVACTEEEEIMFKFFLHSMARESRQLRFQWWGHFSYDDIGSARPPIGRALPSVSRKASQEWF